ncbi:MAG: bifunctional [glutamate--ammonia ligase]-adenylyl-L-tyrosine phosphorylase/[glutamate--ammonia-ligase] adenylyltransferase [Myxococcota bacterium]
MGTRYEKAAENRGLSPSPEVREVADALERHAPALMNLVLADPAILPDVLQRPLDRAEDQGSLAVAFEPSRNLGDGPALWRALRRTRHRAMIRIALREVLRLADIDQTSAELAALASASLDAAMHGCRLALEDRYGLAASAEGPVPFVALGMGKLGGQELNFGSDIDLIFFYGTDDAEVGDGSEVSVHEFFSKAARAASRALSEVTEDGFVFRVDLRLRPEGSRGPVVNSLASAERYYESFGRTWERAALLRARSVAGDLAFGDELLEALRPFVYRRSVDPSLALAMHDMTRRARTDLRADEDRNIKLGRGGIREAEFFVQTLQLIWGGRHLELRTQGTIEALRGLETLGLVSHADAETLEGAWALLRRVEHRIHMTTGYQTHDLPVDRKPLSESLGFASVNEFDAALSAAREGVRELFDSLLPEAPAEPSPFEGLLDDLADGVHGEALIDRVQRELDVRDPEEAAAHLHRLARVPSSPFGAIGRSRRPTLAPLLLSEANSAADVDAALRFTADFLLRGGFGYEAVLVQEPRLARRLVGLFGVSPTLARSLVGHPEAIGEVVLGHSAPARRDIETLHADVSIATDAEVLVSTIRRIKRELTLRIGLAYVGGELGLRDTQTLLSETASAQIEHAFACALQETGQRWGDAPGAMAVVGMGKLGSAEMGFGSDLDLIFVYERDGESGKGRSAQEFFARVAQRTIRLLSQPDAEGPGYETDTRLRPSGSQGTLVTSVDAFRRYHEERAEGWERQALVRARVVTASHPTFEAPLRSAIAHAAYEKGPTDASRLATLRRRMERELAGERARRYHPKLGYGALVDIELATQWLQMRHGKDARVRTPHTLDALRALTEYGYLPADQGEALRDAYELFRAVEQSLALVDRRTSSLLFGGPRALAVARAIGLRARDGVSPDEVLERLWRRRAEDVRRIFEDVVAPIKLSAPWSAS